MKTRYLILALCFTGFCLSLKAQSVYSLIDCERMAIKNNNRMKNSQLDVDIAKQTRKEAFTGYFPSVSGTGTYFNTNRELLKTNLETQSLVSPELAATLPVELLGAIPPSIPIALMKNGTVAGVTATQPIFAGGRIINGNKLARIGETVAGLQLELTEEEVILTTHAYYWQVANLKEKLETIAAVEGMLNSLMKDVTTAVKAGLTTRNDLLRVELQLQETASNRLRIENGISVCKMQLAQFIGADVNGFDIEHSISNDYREPAALYRDAASVVIHRTETKLLDQDINATKLKTKLSWGEQLPTVAIGGGYLYNNLLNSSTNSGVIFVTASVPVSGWWGGSHARKKHKFMEQQAINNRTNSLELMIVETNQTWNELVESYEQIRLAESTIHSATENLRIVSNSYKAGVVPLTELLDAQVLFQQSKNQHSDACSTYRMKVLRYKQITDN